MAPIGCLWMQNRHGWLCQSIKQKKNIPEKEGIPFSSLHGCIPLKRNVDKLFVLNCILHSANYHFFLLKNFQWKLFFIEVQIWSIQVTIHKFFFFFFWFTANTWHHHPRWLLFGYTCPYAKTDHCLDRSCASKIRPVNYDALPIPLY